MSDPRLSASLTSQQFCDLYSRNNICLIYLLLKSNDVYKGVYSVVCGVESSEITKVRPMNHQSSD